MSRFDAADVVLYTQGWDIDRAADGSEPPTDQISGRLFINGTEAPRFASLRVLARNDNFLTLSVRFSVSTLRIVPLANLEDLGSVLPELPLPEEAP